MSASCMNDIHTARTYVRQPHGMDRSTSVFHPASSMYARMRKPSQAKHRIYILVRPLLREIRRKTKNLGYPCPAFDFSNICRPHTHFRDEKKINRRAEIHQINHYPKNSVKRFFHPSIHPLLSIAAQESRKCQRNFACKTDEKTTMCTHDLLCGSTRRSCLPNLR